MMQVTKAKNSVNALADVLRMKFVRETRELPGPAADGGGRGGHHEREELLRPASPAVNGAASAPAAAAADLVVCAAPADGGDKGGKRSGTPGVADNTRYKSSRRRRKRGAQFLIGGRRLLGLEATSDTFAATVKSSKAGDVRSLPSSRLASAFIFRGNLR